MKKILAFCLVLCVFASMAASFAVSASADDIQVSIGQKFEYNSQAATADSQLAWRKQAGSPDGLWQYEMYALEKKAYYELVFSSESCFAWMKTPGSTGVGYARVRDNGTNFHPAQLADVVKTFHCPSGGKIQFTTTVARDTEWTSESNGTPSSIAIYLDDELVYPTGGAEYEQLTSTTPSTIKLDLEVKKHSRIRVHIGAIGDQGSDGVDMENTVIYKSVNNEVLDPAPERSVPYGTGKVDEGTGLDPWGPSITDRHSTKTSTNVNTGAQTGNENNGGFPVVPVVIGVVAVVAVAVVVVLVLKKKKAE